MEYGVESLQLERSPVDWICYDPWPVPQYWRCEEWHNDDRINDNTPQCPAFSHHHHDSVCGPVDILRAKFTGISDLEEVLTRLNGCKFYLGSKNPVIKIPVSVSVGRKTNLTPFKVLLVKEYRDPYMLELELKYEA